MKTAHTKTLKDFALLKDEFLKDIAGGDVTAVVDGVTYIVDKPGKDKGFAKAVAASGGAVFDGLSHHFDVTSF